MMPYGMDAIERRKFTFANGNPKPGAREAFEDGYEPWSGAGEGEDPYRGRDPREMGTEALRALGHEGVILKAVRENCVQCCSGEISEVRRCRLVWCPMWPYRLGENPCNTRNLTDDQRAAIGERLKHRMGEKRGGKDRLSG